MKHRYFRPALLIAAAMLSIVLPLRASGQAPPAAPVAPVVPAGAEVENRPVDEVRFEGLVKVPTQLVLNNIRMSQGVAYKSAVVQGDIIRLTHLGRFRTVVVRVEKKPDGSLILIYTFEEWPLLVDVGVNGNKAVGTKKLLQVVLLRSGDPADEYLIEKAMVAIKTEYKKEGYYLTDVTYDRDLLKDKHILIFRIREGTLIRIKAIKFQGNTVFKANELETRIKAKAHAKIIFFDLVRGDMSSEDLLADAGRIRDYYRSKGFLDAQVGREISLSPDGQDAVITFVISEGKQFTVDKITVINNHVFSTEQVLAAMPLKPGDVYSDTLFSSSEKAVYDLYGKLGFIDVTVRLDRLFHQGVNKLDVTVTIGEGRYHYVDRIIISGNETTQDKLILREVRGLEPGRRFDAAGMEKTHSRLLDSPFFSDASVTVLGSTDELYRSVLVQVKEKKTGDLSLGAGVDTDLGVVGTISVSQRNFDITDWPQSFSELFSGKAFRGAGQFFNLTLAPGTEFSQYSMTFGEPHLFDSDIAFSVNPFYTNHGFDLYSELRAGVNFSFGHVFSDTWSASVNIRAANIDITDISLDAPTDVFAVAGKSTLTSIGLTVARNTTDNRRAPSSGSLLEFNITQYGILTGDYQFTKVAVRYRRFWTVSQDFLENKSILILKADAGYIFDSDPSPFFERFFLGGRSFRGFKYRGAGPIGVTLANTLTDQGVGGNFMYFLGLEYNAPIFKDILRYVLFVDSGSVSSSFTFSEYRASIGAGIRLKLPMFGQAPLAFDVAYPILHQENDLIQYFSFSIDVPF